jgi:peptide deformylase
MPSNFKPKYKLVDPSSQIMNEPVEMFDFANPPMDPTELSLELTRHMNHFKGVGLSANQLGLPYRVFAMVGKPDFVCFNPSITAATEELALLDEGCLSWPGLYAKIKRPANIRAKWYDVDGNVVVQKFSGISSRCFQHELEHLEGGRFIDHLSPFALQRARTAQEKLLKKVRRGLKNAAKQSR